MKKHFTLLCSFLIVFILAEAFSFTMGMPRPDISGTEHSEKSSPSEIISKKYSLIYQNDNTESYQTGMFSYGFSSGFNGMDLEGNGQKAIVVSTQTSVNDTSVLSFLSPVTLLPIWQFKSGGYDSIPVTTYTSNAQLTGSSEHEYMIWRSEGNTSGDSVYFQVFSKSSQKPLFSAKQDNDQYLAPISLIDNTSGWNDLTGDSLLEFCRVKTNQRTMMASITVYNDLKPIDTIFVPFKSSMITVAFSNDINSDGKPEIVFTDGSGVSLYQWNTESRRFEKLAFLNSVISMYSIPINVDSDPEKEILTLSSTSDSIYVYSKDFQKKTAITIKDKKISSFYVVNLNNSPNSEIVVSASGAEGFLTETYVYDLSTSDQPVWSDNTFSILGVFDLMGKGYSQLFGISRAGFTTKLLDGANGFKPSWEIKGSNIAAVGPFIPGRLLAFGLSGGFNQIYNPDIMPADLDNDGKKEIIVSIRDTSSTAVYAVLESGGTIEDSLLSITNPGTIYTQAYDFTNNGYPEIIVSQSSLFGQGESRTWILEMQNTVGIPEYKKTFNDYYLNQNYPNPFNPSTTISYNLPEQTSVELKIFDMLGREITTLVRSVQPAGRQSVRFDAAGLSSGMYICRLKAGKNIMTRKMIVAK